MRPAVYPERSQRGYTLIELLVVMSIISILAIVGFVNFRTFSADQVTNKAAGEIQTVLRLAQSNATSSTFCNDQSGVNWTVIFNTGGTTINLICGPTNFLQRTYTLTNAQVHLRGSGCGSDNAVAVSVTYAPRIGTLSFTGEPCLLSSSSIAISVLNTKDTGAASRIFNLSKGGAIDVQ